MGNRLYVAGIVLFWMAAMSWLVVEKVLPSLLADDPPRSGSLRQTEPVAWEIRAGGQLCGSSVLQAVDGVEGFREVLSSTRIDRIPSPLALPPWLSAVGASLDSVALEMKTRTAFDTGGRLTNFRTRLNVNQLDFPIVVAGSVAGTKLRLTVNAGPLRKRVDQAWPAEGVLASEIVPESKLINVYPGKRWRKEVFNPLAKVGDPVEVLEATVEGDIKISHGGDAVRVRVVEFRSPGRTGASDADRLRAKMWVAEDGRVLKQETYLFGSCLTFTRLDDERSRTIAIRDLQIDREASILTPDLGPASDEPASDASAPAETPTPADAT